MHFPCFRHDLKRLLRGLDSAVSAQLGPCPSIRNMSKYIRLENSTERVLTLWSLKGNNNYLMLSATVFASTFNKIVISVIGQDY